MLLSVTLIYKDCGVNITEINPDYVKDLTNTPEFIDKHNFVECMCTNETREVLFTKLNEKAKKIHCLPDKGTEVYHTLSNYNVYHSLIELPRRNNVNQDYCVVAFSLVNEVGSLARALMVFAVSSF